MEPVSNQKDNRILVTRQIIRQLRLDDLNNGFCFMIFDDNLPNDQAYYEYPDGNIRVEKVDKENLYAERLVIRTLTKKEGAAVRKRHEVFY